MHPTIALFRYGMLYSAYGPTRWYWAAVVASRKAAIVFVTAIFSDPGQEVHWLILFLGTSIMANMFFEPYKGARDVSDEAASLLQRFDSMSLFVLMVTAWSGVYFTINNKCTGEHAIGCAVLLIAIMAMNTVFFFYCLYHFKAKLISAKYFIIDLLRYFKTGVVEKQRRATGRKKNSVHRNPLVYRRTLVATVDTVNPFHDKDNHTEERARNLKEAQRKVLIRTKSLQLRQLRSKSTEQRSQRLKRFATARRKKANETTARTHGTKKS
eukprot:Stramenopile-MAST_4_protein_6196